MAFSLEEYWDTGDGSLTNVYGVQWRAQTFLSAGGFSLTRVSIKAYRVGAPGEMTLSIYATDVNKKPTGAPLGTATADADEFTDSSPGDWYDFDFETPVTISASTRYAIVCSIPSGDASNQVNWRINTAGSSYPDETFVYSTNSGVAWTVSNSDLMFRTYSGADASYVDFAGSFAIAVGLSGAIEVDTYVDFAGSFAIAIGVSGALQLQNIVKGGGGSSPTKCRLVAIGNNSLYYEDV